jgi:hypothetical protein
VLREVYTNPDDATSIIDRHFRYLAKASLLGWKTAEEPPPLAAIAKLTPIESELYQRKQLETISRPPLPAAFQSAKPLTASNIKVPKTDRMGKPIETHRRTYKPC